MAVNDDLADALTSHQIGLLRLSNATVRKILAQLRRSETAILERLTREDISELSRKRQEALLADIRRIVQSAHKDATGALAIELDQLAIYEGQYQQDLFKRIVPLQINYVTPSAEQIVAAVNARPFQGRLLKDWYSDLDANAAKRLRNTIRTGFIEGRTVGQMIRDIRGTRANGYKDGVLQVNRRAAEVTVRTAVNHTANAAREHVYERNSDVIKGVRFNATLDSRTTLVCASNDGKVFEPGKGPRPPLHPNCRSSTSPVVKSWRELGFDVDEVSPGTRASMNGQVPADQDYDGWLRKQPSEFQDDILGKAKGELFREGVKVDRFVDRSGREYTLDELRRREADAWQRTAA